MSCCTSTPSVADAGHPVDRDEFRPLVTQPSADAADKTPLVAYERLAEIFGQTVEEIQMAERRLIEVGLICRVKNPPTKSDSETSMAI